MGRKPDPSRSTKASRRYHDRMARRYDQIYDDAYWEFHDELTWRAIKPFIPADLSSPCLDLGCGTGKWGLKLLKTGLPTTFVDHSPAMIDEARAKAEALGPKAKRATMLVADIVDLSALAAEHFALTLAMGDPLSICSDPPKAAGEMFRLSRPGGFVIATADSKLAAIDHFMERGDVDGLEQFVRTGRTHWLTENEREQFELHMFTPEGLRRMFEKAGFEVISLTGKTILPVRKNQEMLKDPRTFERLMRIEQELAKDSSSAARASHFQIVGKRRMKAEG